MKRCHRCDTVKPSEEFSKNRARKDGLQTYCKSCMSSSYKKTKKEYRTAYRARMKWWLRLYKNSHGCQKCFGDFDTEQLDIHHVDPKIKEIDPGKMPRQRWSVKRMLQELEGCKVLCKACHKEEHRRPTFGTSVVHID